MAFNLLTVGREFGCGSGEIAHRLGQALGWRVFDRELIDEIARIAHLEPSDCTRADERVDSWMHRIGKGLWNAAGEKGPALVPDQSLDADAMAALTRSVIEDLASIGHCVIVGRGANYVLRDRRDAFHLFLYAPLPWRIRRLHANGIASADAEAQIRQHDHDRAAYIRRYFGESWPQLHLYHLAADASLGPDAVCAALLSLLRPA